MAIDHALRLNRLRAFGFDASTHTFNRPALISVACSQCQSAVINGTATHEHGCPNQVYECVGCSNLVTRRGAYCADCQ